MISRLKIINLFIPVSGKFSFQRVISLFAEPTFVILCSLREL